MTTSLQVLVAKDLRRARRNPLPYLIHLAVPLVITGLLGMIFGRASSSEGEGLGRIQLAIVDEDDTALTGFFRGAFNQGEAGRRFEARVLGRDEAMGEIGRDAVAAVFVIPRGFTSGFLGGHERVTLELVKNPARRIHPAIVEELLGAGTAFLNALARNFGDDLAAWRELFETREPRDWRDVGELVIRTGEKAELVWRRLDPLPVYYRKEAKAAPAPGVGSPGFDMFAYLLPGLSAMFMLFLADVSMRDLHRERRFRTYDRLCTLPTHPWLFVLGKVVFTLAMLAIGAVVLLGGGALIFGFRWRDPMAVAGLASGLAVFAGGLMATLGGLVGNEKKADVINSVVGMAIALASGCAFPAEGLPVFLRDYITPWLPPYWFTEAVRASQFPFLTPVWPWPWVAAGMAGLGLVLVTIASRLLQRRLAKGTRE